MTTPTDQNDPRVVADRGGADYEQLIQESGRVTRAARRLLRDEHLAEDAVQQAWVSLLQAPPRDRRGIGAWFSTVSQNAARKLVRGRARAALRERAAAGHERTNDLSPAAKVDSKEAARAVSAAVLRLDEPYRSTIIERYFLGHSLREIARRDGVPIATLRSRLQRAHARLRGDLEHRFGDRTHACRGLLAIGGVGSTTLFLVGATLDRIGRGVERSFRTSRVTRAAPAALAIILGFGVAIRMWDAPTPPSYPGALAGGTSRAAAAPDGSFSRAPSRVAIETVVDQSPEQKAPLTVLVSHTEDGAAAAGARVRAISWSDPAPHLQMVVVTADSEGLATFPSVPDGPATLLLDAGSALEVVLSKDAPLAVSMRLPVGVDVHGTVLDAEGHPAANRPIWLSTDDDARSGSVVATTDAWGGFRLRDVPPGRRIGALSIDPQGIDPGMGSLGRGARALAAPSLLSTVTGTVGMGVELGLRLTKNAAAITGTVQAENGDPIAGALVRIEAAASGQPGTRGDGAGSMHGMHGTRRGALHDSRPGARHEASFAPSYPPTTIRTRRDGTFRAAGLPAGLARVWVRAPGAAPSTKEFVLAIGETQDASIALSPGAVVSGQVLDRRGFPAAGALVHCGEPLSVFGAMARSDDRGRYVLSGLMSGAASLAASGVDGEVQSTLSLAAGVDHPWNPELGGRAVEGRVIDGAGRPVSGVHVSLEREAQLAPRVQTDQEGRFRLSGLPSAGGSIRVTGANGVPWGTQAIGPHERVVEVRASDPAIFGASLAFAIDAGGNRVRTVRLTAPSFSTEACPTADGQVRFGNLPPATYSLVAWTDRGALALGTVAICANQRRRLDPVVLPASIAKSPHPPVAEASNQ